MKIVIRVADRHQAQAGGSLVRHSAGTALPNYTFIVSDLAVVVLRNAGIDSPRSRAKLKQLALRERPEPIGTNPFQ